MPITETEWDLHRHGHQDSYRHQEKLKDAFKKNLQDIISREDIITENGEKRIRVPIKALDNYHFTFDPKKIKGLGQGDGETQVGDVLEKEGDGNPNDPSQAGDEGGDEYYEAEIDLEDLLEMMMEDLNLPRLDPKKASQLTAPEVRYEDIHRKGALSNLDKKRTLIENIKRNARQHGKAQVEDINEDDLRFRTWNERQRPITSAVVIACMDISGSMTSDRKYVARSFFFWMVNFLRRKYENVEIVFISHTTTAQYCTEHEFFYRGESGGTMVSSAYKLALETIHEKYDPAQWNIFTFHFSDGDTWNDQQECVDLLQQLCEVCNMVGYGEIRLNSHDLWGFGYGQTSPSLYDSFKDSIKQENFVIARILQKTDVWKTLRKFFAEELTE